MTAEPMKPAPPVTRMFIRAAFLPRRNVAAPNRSLDETFALKVNRRRTRNRPEAAAELREERATQRSPSRKTLWD